MFSAIQKPSSIFEPSLTASIKVNPATASSLMESEMRSGGLKTMRYSDSFTKAPERALYRRSKEGDPSVSVVNMNEGKAIEVQAGKKHTLFTYALGGCQAVLVLGEHSNGKKTAILTHYQPTHRLENLQTIQQLVRQHPDLKSQETKLTSIILVPKDEQENPETDKYILTLVNALQSTVKAELCKNLTEKVFHYSMANPTTGKSSAFIIKFPAKANKPVRYEAHGTYYGKLDDET